MPYILPVLLHLPFCVLICGLSSELRPNNLLYFCPTTSFSPSSHSPTAIGVIFLKPQQQKPVSRPLWVKSDLLRVAASIICALTLHPDPHDQSPPLLACPMSWPHYTLTRVLRFIQGAYLEVEAEKIIYVIK